MMLGLVAGGGFAGWYYFGGGYDVVHNTAKVNFQRQVNALENLADGGDRDARRQLGDLFANPSSRFKDLVEASRQYQMAATAGDADAQVALGKMYEAGYGVDQDFQRAAELYRFAAKTARDVEAQFRLADMYFHGRGFANDYDNAIEFYGKAARGGHPVAQYLLGIMYKDGWGVRKNAEEAFLWLSLAMRDEARVRAENAKYDPRAQREQVLINLNKTQVNRTERRIKRFLEAWKPKQPKS